MNTGCISLRGVEVNNLQNIDLDIRRGRLVVVCGVSGSGKTSLALDTLYAEGQRRFIESFSAYTRQFLQRLEKPAAQSITGLPPAIAVTHKGGRHGNRATVGTATEVTEYLRLLYAKIGRTFCPGCGSEIGETSPQQVAQFTTRFPESTRFMVAFARSKLPGTDASSELAALAETGFVRTVIDEKMFDLSREMESAIQATTGNELLVIADRLKSGGSVVGRVTESVETAMSHGTGRCLLLLPKEGAPLESEFGPSRQVLIDGVAWRCYAFSKQRNCEYCQTDFPTPQPNLYSFNSPLGACPTCEGFGDVAELDWDLVVPDSGVSIRDGAIAPWNTKTYRHNLDELLNLASDFDLPVDIPFRDLNPEHQALLREGVPERKFAGLLGFFQKLGDRKNKTSSRVISNRWRSYRRCPDCHGTRLRPEALATRVAKMNLAEVCGLKIVDAMAHFESLEMTAQERQISNTMDQQIRARLRYLDSVGLGYLTLDRSLATLSGGEAQRVALSTALGSSLVNMLYVLDEPSVGLHPHDVQRLAESIGHLRSRGNSVIVVEHEEAMIRAAEELIEIGPAAGERGGKIVFQGTLDEMMQCQESLTGGFLAGRRGVSTVNHRRPMKQGKIRLSGARGNNLQNIDVDFPLGMLCVVTGVSGSGKTTLVQGTLYPALCHRKHKSTSRPYDYDDVFGDGQIDEVIMVDQSPIGRSPRSNPVTYIKVFDEIRNVFAETLESRTQNFTAGHFSFNVEGGRCDECKGDGYLAIDMQFLDDVYMKCSRCDGRRYRKEILSVKYRGRSIADVLEMTVREAFAFFRGKTKVQKKLSRLIDVGLDYLRLGQPANTLSGGEAQRLKLAAYLSSAKKGRSLFILDEPTTGLHFSDVIVLLDCFDALIDIGHSLIVIEHNLQVMRAADHIIDLGPGAADKGGQVVAQGTPEDIVSCAESITGRYLGKALAAAQAAAAEEASM